MRFPLLLLVGLAPPAGADTLVVPDDFSSLEEAVDAADAGDLILVQTTQEQGRFGIFVDKSLTIMGDPICNIDLRLGGIELAGPGRGSVTLVNCEIDYISADENGYRSLWGSGFEEVHLVGCRVVHQNLAPSGLITSSYPAIDLEGELLLTLTESELIGGHAGSDACSPPAFYQNGSAGIMAPDAVVVLIDSSVTGGNGGPNGPAGNTLDMCCSSCSCPDDLSLWGGHGGDGVVARELHSWRSSVRGGNGIAWYAFPGGTDHNPTGMPTLCGQQPDGTALRVTEELVLGGRSSLYTATSRPRLGSEWTLTWDVDFLPACRGGGTVGGMDCYRDATALLLSSFGPPRVPLAIGGLWTYLDPSAFRVLTVFPALSEGEIDLVIPNSLPLVGLGITLQVALTNGDLSGPVVGIVVP